MLILILIHYNGFLEAMFYPLNGLENELETDTV